jgi:hypothetical protein
MDRVAIVLSLLIMLLAAPAHAVDPSGPKHPRQVPLSPALVERFMASYEPVKAFNAQYDQEWRDENFSDPTLSSVERMRQTLEAHGALKAFNALVAQYGFAGVEDWWVVACSTMIAYGFSEPGHDPAKAKAEVERALQDLDKKPGLSPAQKIKYRAALTQSLENYEALEPPSGNIAVVTPYRAKLKTLLGE